MGPGMVREAGSKEKQGFLDPVTPPGLQLPSSGFVISVNCQALSIVCDFIVDVSLRQFSNWGLSQIVF